MMKKIIATLILAVVSVAAFAGDNSVSALAVTGIKDGGWRGGFSSKVLDLDQTVSTRLWLLTDIGNNKNLKDSRMYVGGGFNFPAVEVGSFSVDFNLGWSGSFVTLKDVKYGQWGVGFGATYRW